MSAAEDLATQIRSGVPARTTVYAYPPDVLKLPAVVISPADPWVQPSTKGVGYRINLEVSCQVPRTNPRNHLPKLEKLVDAVVASLLPGSWRFVEAGGATEVTTGDVEAIGSSLLLTTAITGGLSP